DERRPTGRFRPGSGATGHPCVIETGNPARQRQGDPMKRFLKPLIAGAALLTLAIPALASAQPYAGGHAYADRGDYARSYHHDRWERDYRYRHDWRYRYWRHHHHHHWRDGRYDGGWR